MFGCPHTFGRYTLNTDLFLSGGASTLTDSSVPGLHLQYRAKELLRGLREEADLSVGMEAVQVGRLGGEGLVYVLERSKYQKSVTPS